MLTQLFFLLGIGLPIAIALGLGRSKPGWSKRKVALWSAAPIPAIASIPCLIIIGYAATAALDNCGIDRCETEMDVGLFLLAVTSSVFVIGSLLALAAVALARRSTPGKSDVDVFE